MLSWSWKIVYSREKPTTSATSADVMCFAVAQVGQKLRDLAVHFTQRHAHVHREKLGRFVIDRRTVVRPRDR